MDRDRLQALRHQANFYLQYGVIRTDLRDMCEAVLALCDELERRMEVE